MGIKIAVEWFKSRGHKEITVFVPMWRKEQPKIDAPIKGMKNIQFKQNQFINNLIKKLVKIIIKEKVHQFE